MDILENSSRIQEAEGKISYSTGIVMAQSLKDIGFDEINLDDFLEGFKQSFNNSYTKITKKRAIDIFNNYVTILRADQVEKTVNFPVSF